MHALAKSATFHLAAPFASHLVLAFLLVRKCAGFEMVGILFGGGLIALLGIALISLPFGMVHLLQVILFARSNCSPRDQFLVGLLNPSFALLTIAITFFLAPDRFF